MPRRTIGSIRPHAVLQLAVDKDLHRRGAAEGCDRTHFSGGDRLDPVQRLVVGAAAENRREAELLNRRRRELGKPALVLAIEVAARIALAARIEAARTESGK